MLIRQNEWRLFAFYQDFQTILHFRVLICILNPYQEGFYPFFQRLLRFGKLGGSIPRPRLASSSEPLGPTTTQETFLEDFGEQRSRLTRQDQCFCLAAHIEVDSNI